jgi:transposase-like protein
VGDTMFMAFGVTLDGEMVILGFVQTGTENGVSLTAFLRDLLDRGLLIDQGAYLW